MILKNIISKKQKTPTRCCRCFIYVSCSLLSESLLEVGADSFDEVEAVNLLGLDAFHEVNEVLCYDACVEGVEASAFELVAKVD